jgi:hypothetical protein
MNRKKLMNRIARVNCSLRTRTSMTDSSKTILRSGRRGGVVASNGPADGSP